MISSALREITEKSFFGQRKIGSLSGFEAPDRSNLPFYRSRRGRRSREQGFEV
jgi:hypothetical protein